MTLLEVLVAMAVFAVLSVIAYSGLRAVLDAREAALDQAQALSGLQRALSWMGGDLEEMVARPIRDAYGDSRPALDGSSNGYLEWTRAGWSNPAGHLRSSLQRVAYRLEDGRLLRSVWYVLDRAQDTEPEESVMLEGVRSFRYRMLDAGRDWQEDWPTHRDREPMRSLPLAVEVILDTERWGSIRRLVPLPGSA